jgi:glutamate 5-kinase
VEALQAASAVGQGKLYRTYDELLQTHGVRSAQVLLTFFDVSARTHYLNARHTLETLLRWHVVPVINENDTTTTDEISFGDNDFLAAQVAILVGADRLVLLTDAGGLYEADPRSEPDARLVEEVTDLAELQRYDIGVSTSPLGSGGMRSKVVAAEMATAAGIPVTITSGVDADAMTRALAGEPAGTRFHPQKGRVSSFKLWLRYAKPTQGRLAVDEGAERALRERGTSLLPVGVVGVEGEFEAGDAVEVRCDGRVVGKGIVNYSASELQRIKGLKTEAVRELLPRATEEAVHRDYFVLD